MELREREEIRLLIDDGRMGSSCSPPSIIPSSFSSIRLCRICHEEEEESSTSMESPCACSGTLKFAHRECIQRWCDEKGSTICEICLQAFEPGYTVPPKKALVEVPVTIRGSLEVPRLNYDPQNPALINRDYAECSSESQRSASWCRSVALVLTIMLLFKHLITVLAVGADHYAFTVLTVFVLRASGILLPCYLIMRVISVIQRGQRQYQLEQLQLHGRNDSPTHGVEDVESQ
ncbi:uncharacterized protein LOC103700961 isoform X2 [Phoenix dactylifera]|uniref:Uncharacterized protein LOC103700961 isoform X2 n=1 Tax=Phoenix dactylifera TaxID=42345 RepID=A0A8B7BLK5_PHODC|nr:uncharacterized protein LOC103700961 isoform X2 [Phoenix dactylifera]